MIIPKIIVTDLDNTLLRNDKTVSSYTQSVFREAKKCGILIVFATARYEASLVKLIKKLLPDVVISSVGSLARKIEDGEVLFCQTIDTKTTRKIILRALEANALITVDTLTGYFVNYNKNQNSQGDISSFNYIKTDFMEDTDLEALEIAVECKESIEVISRNIRILPPYIDSNLRTFISKEASKMEALNAVLTRYSINFSDVVAFGDDLSDCEMLKRCGYGIAVSNAHPDTKEIADTLCESNEDDGVAKWIASNILR